MSKVIEPLPGLTVITEYITLTEELNLILCTRAQQWNKKLDRYTQHYGYEYDYNTKTLVGSVPPIPSWIEKYSNRLVQDTYFKEKPDQVIINRYKEGESISAHIDHVKYFGNTIASISLGAPCTMIFQKANPNTLEYDAINRDEVQLQLQPRSLVIMKDDARYKYKHSIRKLLPGSTTRYSVTFRNVIQKPTEKN